MVLISQRRKWCPFYHMKLMTSTLFIKICEIQLFLKNSTLAERPLETSHKIFGANKVANLSLRLHFTTAAFSNMATVQTMLWANLVEQQDKETLLEVSLYASGCSKFKGSESSALSLLNKLRFEGEAGFCDVTLRVKRKQLTSLAFWRQTVNSLNNVQLWNEGLEPKSLEPLVCYFQRDIRHARLFLQSCNCEK
mgnify:FL=1